MGSLCREPVQYSRQLLLSSFGLKMVFLLLLLSLVPLSLAQRSSLGSCEFSRDCQKHVQCQNIADASCVCNFGQCVISGNPFFRGSECNTFADCDCRYASNLITCNLIKRSEQI